MTSNPWDKFFWNDWENDPALKLCGLSAQGLWMRCLCICAKADPKGYLVVAGRPLSPSDLSSLVGKPEPEVETLLRELLSYGVYSTDRVGRIYSRRMVRDVKRARIAADNGNKGGNPSLSKQSENSASVNPPDNPGDKPQEPRATNHKSENKKERASAPMLPSLQFPDWWPTAPWQAFTEVRKKKRAPLTDRAVELLIGALVELRVAGHDPAAVIEQSIMKGWTGFFPLKNNSAGAAVVFLFEDANTAGWVERLKVFHGFYADEGENPKKGGWVAKWGPAPGLPGCRVPQSAFDAFAARHPSQRAQEGR